VEAGRRVHDGSLYQATNDYAFRASPILALLFSWLAVFGPTAWRLLHLAAATAMPTWPLRLAVLAAWPFWFDLQHGNLLPSSCSLPRRRCVAIGSRRTRTWGLQYSPPDRSSCRSSSGSCGSGASYASPS
jgi:hypothetical protein